MIINAFVFCVIAMLNVCVLFSQHAEIESWEPQDVHTTRTGRATEVPVSFLSPITEVVIGAYQVNAGRTSVERCPFHLSCSRFAVSSVNKYGVLGVCMFIDRFFFREHPAIQLYYPYRANSKGVLKLDDHDFQILY